METADWKDNEFGYCRRLVATQGNKNVGFGRGAIASYLRLQQADALRAGRADIAAKLALAALEVTLGNFKNAVLAFG